MPPAVSLDCSLLGSFLTVKKGFSQIARFMSKLNAGSMAAYDAKVAFKAMFELSLFYSSGVTWISEQDCESLHQLAHPAWLRAIGYNAQFPNAVAHAPWGIGGVYMVHFYVMRGIQGLALFLGHLRASMEVRKLIHVGIEVFHLISGTSWCFFA